MKTEVVIPSYEDGFDPVTECKKIQLQPRQKKEWYYGVYDKKTDGTPAVLLDSKFRRADKEDNDG